MTSDEAGRDFDAIVVGSGISGGWAAKELTEKGLRTLLLEAGPSIVPARDYAEHVPPWDVRFRGWGSDQLSHRDQPIQHRSSDEWNAKFFVNDRDNPYHTEDGKPFSWIRGRQVGGKSIVWGRHVYRLSDLDFEANAKEGIGVDWPIRYADIAPWYDRVERFIGVSGQAEGLDHLPDGQFLPPMELRCAEIVVRDAMRAKWGRERILTMGRLAILTQAHNGRAPCHYCGPCSRGCITHSYFSSIGSTLPAAAATGRLTLRPNSIVERVLYDEKADRASGVRVIDADTRQVTEFTSRVVFLCASALESTRILLNSATSRFPTGLANSSGELGRNLMDHVSGGGATAIIPGMEDMTVVGRRPNGIYIPRFRNVKTRHPGFLRGYGYQGQASRAGWERGSTLQGFGAAFKESLIRELGPWAFWINGFGECLPRADNFVAIHPTLKDKWGIPSLTIQCAWGPNERAMLKDMQVAAAETLEAAGAKQIQTFDRKTPPGQSVHEMGTARMGHDPKTSVLNRWNQCHDVPNVFVTDGACMTSSASQNPSLTYMALTARACDYAVQQLKRNEI